MMKQIVFFGLMTTLSVGVHAKSYDKQDEIKGVILKSGKEKSNRYYAGSLTKTIPHSLRNVMSGVINFQEKCNNDYKDKRKYTSDKLDCKYHNDHLIETMIIKDIKTQGWAKVEGERERYITGRRVYNRGNFGYYELIQVIDGKNEQKQNTVTIIQKMLSDKEAKLYVDPKFKRESAFDESIGVFTLTELSPTSTEITYAYNSQTEHWILNKEVSVPQVFASISKSINDLMITIDKESSIQSRDLASH